MGPGITPEEQRKNREKAREEGNRRALRECRIRPPGTPPQESEPRRKLVRREGSISAEWFGVTGRRLVCLRHPEYDGSGTISFGCQGCLEIRVQWMREKQGGNTW